MKKEELLKVFDKFYVEFRNKIEKTNDAGMLYRSAQVADMIQDYL